MKFKTVILCVISVCLGCLIGTVVEGGNTDKYRQMAQESVSTANNALDTGKECIEQLHTSIELANDHITVINHLIDFIWDGPLEGLEALRRLPKMEHLEAI